MKTVSTMKKVMMAAAVIGLLNVPPARAADGCCPATPTKDSKVTLRISGMTCDKCAAGIQKALTKVDGVKAAEVSLEKNQAVVTVEAGKAKTDQIIAAVATAGGDRHTLTAQEASEPATKRQQIFCEGKSAGQLCGHGTAQALNLSGEKKAAWFEALKRYNTSVEAATKQVLKEAKETLSSEELAVVEKWFAKGVNAQINQQLAKEETK